MKLYETVTTYRRWYDESRSYENVKHSHIVDAISVSDAESRITEELFEAYTIDGIFQVHSSAESNIDYVILNNNSYQNYFRVKFQFLNPHSKKLKVAFTYDLIVRADNDIEVSSCLRSLFRNSTYPFHIHTIKQCNIEDVFLKDIQDLNEENISQLNIVR